jgi:diguanylate cyclase (GGDEF)-like protein
MEFRHTTKREADKRVSRAIESATIGQRKRALLFCLAIGLMTIAFIPLSEIQRANFPDFLAAYQTAIIAAYFIAAYLIFAFFRANHSLSSLYLCGGCFYAGVVLLVESLSIPSSFASQGVLPGGPQTSVWLWCFWHAALPISIALYALSEWIRPGYVAVHPERTAGWFGVVVAWVLISSIAAVTVFHDSMPLLELDGNLRAMSDMGLVPALMAVTVTALLLLWRATGFRTVLHAWLGVALIALLFDNVITIIGGHRLSVGWYVGHINALISASVMLLISLGEINRAYLKTANSARRLATANALLEAKVDQAGLDFLTGLPARALFTERVRSQRARNIGNGTIVAVLLIDLDGFKKVNDTLGHDQGDLVLKQTAEILRSILRGADIAGRFGGDEFVVCLFAPFSVVQATMINIAGRIVSGIGQLGNGIGCSIGISLCSADRLDLGYALPQADEAMYLAKKYGKNRFVIYGQPHCTCTKAA